MAGGQDASREVGTWGLITVPLKLFECLSKALEYCTKFYNPIKNSNLSILTIPNSQLFPNLDFGSEEFGLFSLFTSFGHLTLFKGQNTRLFLVKDLIVLH